MDKSANKENNDKTATALQLVTKLANETLRPAYKNSIIGNLNILTRKQLEKMSAIRLIEFTMKSKEKKHLVKMNYSEETKNE